MNQTVLVPPASNVDRDRLSCPIVPESHRSKPNGNCSIMSLHTQHDAALRAELYFIMDLVAKNQSANSCQDKKELFQTMFPTSVPESFSLSPSKVSYVLTEALGPYFQKEFVSDLLEPNIKIVPQFDETSNSKKKKEFQVRVSYWSKSQNKIVNRHLVTYFISKGDASTIFEYLLKSLSENSIPVQAVLTIGSDGPNVNKAVINKFNSHLRSLGCKQMIDIGTCLLHVVNNTFVKGVESLPVNVSDFVIKMFYFIDASDLRGEIFEQIQDDLG
ncbi:hypothetical protein QAD02_003389 [Eretmocerus hayati]|uniref:Uncharacterized protein n=1 Tax=Eretmocerus hayati TaxID=131215 RepID=A0ACC2NLI6_9HYME|nr:hypothetical protein QAD02_003389 [Eretmocerus hayati]